MYLETQASAALTGEPGVEGWACCAGLSGESSVDAVKEITELIKAQRGYELNAKVITAVDKCSPPPRRCADAMGSLLLLAAGDGDSLVAPDPAGAFGAGGGIWCWSPPICSVRASATWPSVGNPVAIYAGRPILARPSAPPRWSNAPDRAAFVSFRRADHLHEGRALDRGAEGSGSR